MTRRRLPSDFATQNGAIVQAASSPKVITSALERRLQNSQQDNWSRSRTSSKWRRIAEERTPFGRKGLAFQPRHKMLASPARRSPGCP
eukprot:2023990-Pyramimonas_sp.AAC.1